MVEEHVEPPGVQLDPRPASEIPTNHRRDAAAIIFLLPLTLSNCVYGLRKRDKKWLHQFSISTATSSSNEGRDGRIELSQDVKESLRVESRKSPRDTLVLHTYTFRTLLYMEVSIGV